MRFKSLNINILQFYFYDTFYYQIPKIIEVNLNNV